MDLAFKLVLIALVLIENKFNKNLKQILIFISINKIKFLKHLNCWIIHIEFNGNLK